ncbi:hypothetical protein B7Y92_01490 [Candidatus Saccharibacteria bacterium 32-50-13]|nr:MAG: hypothetical protein B7Y92_01490 [Candidatus Saccharibacteria bacterium 32-50-13]
MLVQNPIVYTTSDLALMSVQQILAAQYQLNLAVVSLLFAIAIYATIFATLKWFVPKFWYKSKETTR